ncbi:MAG: hypothetical protein LIP05_09895 [Tannerellaceae bacterium]|nr:hypothetical protein [Tannerellaceae bacterium]
MWGSQVTGFPDKVSSFAGRYAFPDHFHETFDTQTVIYDYADKQISWSRCCCSET